MNISKQKNNLAISADDFGASSIANQNILELVREGKLDRVSVMPHGSFSQDETSFLLRSGVKIDIHLDMQNHIEKERKLQQGALIRVLFFAKDFLSGKISSRKIEVLWEKQIIDFERAFGKYPDGLNSHQHIHFFPPYFKIILKLAEKFNISFLRFGKKSSFSLKPIPFILNFLRFLDKKHFVKTDLQTTGLMIGADWIRDFDFEKNAPNILSRNSEIIFHPERNNEFSFLKNHPKIGNI